MTKYHYNVLQKQLRDIDIINMNINNSDWTSETEEKEPLKDITFHLHTACGR